MKILICEDVIALAHHFAAIRKAHGSDLVVMTPEQALKKGVKVGDSNVIPLPNPYANLKLNTELINGSPLSCKEQRRLRREKIRKSKK